MKKAMNLKSLLLAVLATLAVNAMAVNNNHDEPTIYQQWEVEDLGAYFNNDSNQLEKYSGVVIDLTETGTFRSYYKFKEDDKWYTVGSGQVIVSPTDETTGTIKLGEIVYNYSLSGDKLTLSTDVGSFTLKVTSGFSTAS